MKNRIKRKHKKNQEIARRKKLDAKGITSETLEGSGSTKMSKGSKRRPQVSLRQTVSRCMG